MRYCLGIDAGTSKIAAVIMDPVTRQVLDCSTVKTEAEIITAPAGFAEQNVEKIMHTLDTAVNALSADLRRQVTAIGITGQMHGVMLWNDKTTSPLYTWQDKRASKTGNLEDIRNLSGHDNLQDGYGAVTLAWMAEKNLLQEWRRAATIHDYVVARFCSLEHPVTDASDAASWGLFDIYAKQWDWNAIKQLRIPERFFPVPVNCGDPAGKLVSQIAAKLGLPDSIPVMAATGDNQASILATSENSENELYLTIGTGAQLSAVISIDELNSISIPSSAEVRPYFDNRVLVVAAALSGGQSLLWLPDTVNAWLKELGIAEISRDEIFKRLDQTTINGTSAGLKFMPNFYGERHDIYLTGSIEGIIKDNFTLGNIFNSLTEGVLENLTSMMPEQILDAKKIVVANGNAVRNLATVRTKIPKVFGLPLKVSDSREEAACGAAMLGFRQKFPGV
jgi:sedoheptulokinase